MAVPWLDAPQECFALFDGKKFVIKWTKSDNGFHKYRRTRSYDCIYLGQRYRWYEGGIYRTVDEKIPNHWCPQDLDGQIWAHVSRCSYRAASYNLMKNKKKKLFNEMEKDGTDTEKKLVERIS